MRPCNKVGTGRLLISLDFTTEDFTFLQARLLAAAERMKADGWWHLGTAEAPINGRAFTSR